MICCLPITERSCPLYHDCFTCPVPVDGCPEWVSVLGQQLRPKRRPDISNDHLLQLKRKGYTLKQAATATGMSAEGIRRRIGRWSNPIPTADELRPLLSSDMTQQEIAEYFGVHRSTLARYGLFKGWKRRGNPTHPINFCLVEKLLRKYNQEQVAHIIGVTPSVLSRRLKTYRERLRSGIGLGYISQTPTKQHRM